MGNRPTIPMVSCLTLTDCRSLDFHSMGFLNLGFRLMGCLDFQTPMGFRCPDYRFQGFQIPDFRFQANHCQDFRCWGSCCWGCCSTDLRSTDLTRMAQTLIPMGSPTTAPIRSAIQNRSESRTLMAMSNSVTSQKAPRMTMTLRMSGWMVNCLRTTDS